MGEQAFHTKVLWRRNHKPEPCALLEKKINQKLKKKKIESASVSETVIRCPLILITFLAPLSCILVIHTKYWRNANPGQKTGSRCLQCQMEQGGLLPLHIAGPATFLVLCSGAFQINAGQLEDGTPAWAVPLLCLLCNSELITRSLCACLSLLTGMPRR